MFPVIIASLSQEFISRQEPHVSICPIRQCARSKNYTSCGSCSEMERCEKLGMIVRNNAEALRNLQEI